MIRRPSQCVVLAALLVASPIPGCGAQKGPEPAVAPTPVLRNPSFDEPAPPGAEIVGWAQQGNTYGRVRLVSSPVVSAPHAAELRALSPGSTGNTSFMIYQVLDHERYRGRRVRFGARVRTQEAGVNLVLYTPEKSSSNFDSNINRGTFVERSGVLDVPKNATFLSFGIQLFGALGAVAWVDDAFVRVEGENGPAGAQQPVSAESARVRIDARRVDRELNPLLFGMHLEWLDDGNGLLAEGRPALRPDVVDLLVPLRIPVFRFPGGIAADYYDWRLGVGAGDQRRQSLNVFSKRMERHRFGTPEFVALLKRTGAEPLITANYGTGTPELAAAWARHLKEAGTAARFWEVGNEIYLSSPTADGPNGREIYHAPENYARDFPRYRRAIHGVFPDALVGAIAHLDNGAFTLAPADNRDWTVRMLGALTTRVDFIAVHNAYAPVILDDSWDFEDEAQRREVYRSMYAVALQVRENLDEMVSTVARLSPMNGSAPIAVTEFGPFFGLSAKPAYHLAYLDQTRTLAAALYAASILDVLIGHPQVFAACYTNPIHRWFGGLIANSDGSLVKTPTYYVYEFYRTRFESRLVPTEVASPSFAARTVGIVKAQTSVPNLVAKASVSVDGRRLTVMLVNRSIDRPLATAVTVEGFMPASAECRVLTAATPAAVNGPSLTRTTRAGVDQVVPRPLPCPASQTMRLTIPANAIVSLVAHR